MPNLKYKYGFNRVKMHSHAKLTARLSCLVGFNFPFDSLINTEVFSLLYGYVRMR